MSRRDSDSRHHRSRLDREPSPKRVRRDGKTATDRPISNLNSAEHINRDEKHHRRMQNSGSLDPAVVPDSKIGTGSLSKESDKKSNAYHERTKSSSKNIEAPRSQSHFQHDERAGQVGRSFRDKETTERELWKDSKNGKTTNRSSNSDDTKKPKDEKTRFDGLHKVEPDSKQTTKKRPSFRETKLPVSAEGSERRKPPVDGTVRMKFQLRDKYGGGSARGRDRYNGQSGGRVEKWKHDLYEEANTTPTSKNEEDQIAKVEALLAS